MRMAKQRSARLVARLLGTSLLATFVAGCASISGAPPRLYAIEEETTLIKDQLKGMTLAEFIRLEEPDRFKYRNDWIAARMYAIDIHYTAYESALTRERQNVGFGAAATTLGLTTASQLAGPVQTKNLLTGLAGFVTGTRAAYDNDILLAHSVQWIQSQMRTQRIRVAERILRGVKRPTAQYPLAEALTDLEDYYRAGTFTGGLIATNETIGAEAKFSEELKDERVEVTFVSTPTTDALTACARRPGAKAQLLKFVPAPAEPNFILLLTGQSPAQAQDVLAKARRAGICP